MERSALPLFQGHFHGAMRGKTLAFPRQGSLGKVWETSGKSLGNIWEDTVAIARYSLTLQTILVYCAPWRVSRAPLAGLRRHHNEEISGRWRQARVAHQMSPRAWARVWGEDGNCAVYLCRVCA